MRCRGNGRGRGKFRGLIIYNIQGLISHEHFVFSLSARRCVFSLEWAELESGKAYGASIYLAAEFAGKIRRLGDNEVILEYSKDFAPDEILFPAYFGPEQ